jgi:hypothetical protein
MNFQVLGFFFNFIKLFKNPANILWMVHLSLPSASAERDMTSSCKELWKQNQEGNNDVAKGYTTTTQS